MTWISVTWRPPRVWTWITGSGARDNLITTSYGDCVTVKTTETSVIVWVARALVSTF